MLLPQIKIIKKIQLTKNTAGFTLIELLVVIAIISLLASVVLVALNTSRVKARDTKRKADLAQIVKALEFYYDSYGAYPPFRAANTCGGYRSDVATSLCTDPNWLSTDANFLTIVSKLPKDPLNKTSAAYSGDDGPWWYANTYLYGVSADRQQYDLITNLESTSDADRCEIKVYKSQALWPNEAGCWSSGVEDRTKQIYSVK